MASCCNNIVTPKMIRTGQVRIGDRIQLDTPVSAPPEPTSSPEEARVVSAPAPETEAIPKAAEVSAPASDPEAAPVSEPAPIPDAVPVQARMTPVQQMPTQMHMPQMQAQQQKRRLDPITYSDMTPYLSEIQMQNTGSQGNASSISSPQSPMTGLEYTQTIDVSDVQAFTGFLSTQIGRYMRVEQLIGSNIMEERFGFLVGIGTNFIILQEITTGNIMVIDLFTIRMTYIYYSQPIFPESVTG